MSQERNFLTINCGSEHVGTISFVTNQWARKNIVNAVKGYLKRKSIKVLSIDFTAIDVDNIIDGSDNQRIVNIIKENGKDMTIVIDIRQTWFYF